MSISVMSCLGYDEYGCGVAVVGYGTVVLVHCRGHINHKVISDGIRSERWD